MKLHTMNLAGNLHEAAVTLNKLDLADYVLCMSSTGHNTIVVLRMERMLVHRLRSESGFTLPVDFDDPQPTKGAKR